MSEPDLECLLQTVEHEAEILATGGAVAREATGAALDDDGFARLVAEALDDLPAFLREELERHVAVVISDDGDSHGAYGLYIGGTVAYRGWSERIVIFRDTLMRDFGRDPAVLRRKVTMVVRHELAHHLGRARSTSPGWGSRTRPVPGIRSLATEHFRPFSRTRCPAIPVPARGRLTRGSARSRELASQADAARIDPRRPRGGCARRANEPAPVGSTPGHVHLR